MSGPAVDPELEVDDGVENLMGSTPVKGVFYSVFIYYNVKHPQIKKQRKQIQEFMESEPIETYTLAEKCSVELAKKIKKKYRGSSLQKLAPEQAEDEYTLFVVDARDQLLAKLGVVAEDYREKTIH